MKFLYFAVIIVGIMIVLNAGGIATPLTSKMLAVAGVNVQVGNESVSGFSNSILWNNDSGDIQHYGILQILLGLSLAGAALSLFGRSPDISYLIGALVAAFSTYIFIDYIYIASLLLRYDVIWIKWISLALFVPLGFAYFISVINFWRGND